MPVITRSVSKQGMERVSRRIQAILLTRIRIIRRKLKRWRSNNALHVGVDQLRMHPIFASWPVEAVSSLRKQMVCESYDRNDVIIYANEPSKASSLYWVVSGRLTEVLSKDDLRRHAAVQESVVDFAEASSTVTANPLSPGSRCLHRGDISLESLANTLAKFRSGCLVSGERLFVGTCYRRTVRCQTNVIILRITFNAARLIMKSRKVSCVSTLLISKTLLRESMERLNEKPSIQDILRCNPAMSGMDLTTLKVLWIRLSPVVACISDVICNNVFNSDTIFFLYKGCVRIGASNSDRAKVVFSCGTSIALHGFLCTEILFNFGETQLAAAVSFCELWSISLSTLQQIVGQKEILKCAQVSRQLIKLPRKMFIIYSLLRKASAFATLSDAIIHRIAKELQLRVVCREDCLLHPAKIPRRGLIVLTGEVYSKKVCPKCEISTAETCERIPMRCGEPFAFDECIAQMPFKGSLFALTSSIIISFTRKAIMEALESTMAVPDINRICENAALRLDDFLTMRRGVMRFLRKTPSSALHHRPEKCGQEKEHVNNHSCKTAMVNDSKISAKKIELNNRVLSSLTVQLRLLPPASTDTQPSTAFNSAPICDVKRHLRHAGSRCNPYRGASCFTIGKDGDITFCLGNTTTDLDKIPVKKSKATNAVRSPQKLRSTQGVTCLSSPFVASPRRRLSNSSARQVLTPTSASTKQSNKTVV